MHFESLFLRDVPWDTLETRQQDCLALVRENPKRGFILLSEPRPTITHGVSAKVTERLWSDEDCSRRGIAIRQVSRGGKWTFHGPGQILLYPILSLQEVGYARNSVRPFVHDLRASVLKVLRELAPECAPMDNPFGIYVQSRKIVSFGLGFPRGISTHGLALYLEPQTESFSSIHPCGVPDGQVVSLAELGIQKDWYSLARSLAEAVKKGFKSAKNSIGSDELL